MNIHLGGRSIRSIIAVARSSFSLFLYGSSRKSNTKLQAWDGVCGWMTRKSSQTLVWNAWVHLLRPLWFLNESISTVYLCWPKQCHCNHSKERNDVRPSIVSPNNNSTVFMPKKIPLVSFHISGSRVGTWFLIVSVFLFIWFQLNRIEIPNDAISVMCARAELLMTLHMNVCCPIYVFDGFQHLKKESQINNNHHRGGKRNRNRTRTRKKEEEKKRKRKRKGKENEINEINE